MSMFDGPDMLLAEQEARRAGAIAERDRALAEVAAVREENDRLHELVDDLRQGDAADKRILDAAARWRASVRAWGGPLSKVPGSIAGAEELIAAVDARRALTGQLEVWDSSVPPGGMVCAVCRTPVESEPCEVHNPQEYAAINAMAGEQTEGA